MRFIYIILVSIIITTIADAKVSTSKLIPHYVYQFANHIKVENRYPLYHIHIISKDSNLKKEFSRVLNSKSIDGKNFRITQADNLDIPKNTNMIYISDELNHLFEKLSTFIEGKSILLISFNEEDKKRVMINLFTTTQQTLNFEINRANILNEGFSISDQIVLMGGTELDVAKLFKGAKHSLIQKELELQESKTKLKRINKQAKELEEHNRLQTIKLSSVQLEVDKQHQQVQMLLLNIQNTKTLMLKEKNLYKLQQEKNKQLKKKMQENKLLNANVKSKLSKRLNEIDEKNIYISKRETDLDLLNNKILEKEKSLDALSKIAKSQDKKIIFQKDTIDNQQDFLQISMIVIGIILIIVGFIVSMLRKQRRISNKLKRTLTRLEETQDELVESEKMASLGELVSGLAHEMNTPIGISITGVSLLQNSSNTLRKKLEQNTLKESDLVNYLDTIKELALSLDISLKKAAELIRSFKQVSVDQQVESLREFNLDEYINTILISFKSQFKHTDIKMHIDIDKSIVLNSYPGIYYQIITNLMNNSLLHAFEDSKEGNISILATVDEAHLHLIYQDDGNGVSEKNLSRIFDPFFTTKKANGGTGLGLHIIYNLITQKLHGKIKATSELNNGLKLELTLPISHK